jgi:hypothetical protein
VKALTEQLKCAAGRHAQACRILREFAMGSTWTVPLPSGGARFVGRAYRIAKSGPENVDQVLFSAVGVPAEAASPADLPIRMGLDTLPNDKRRDVAKLIRALAHGDSVARTNKAVPFVQAFVTGNGRLAMTTTGPSLRLIAEDATYVRQKGSRVLVVRLKATPSGVPVGTGDGSYAEGWAATW